MCVMGCPWHLAHNTAIGAAVVFESVSVCHVLSCNNSINAHVCSGRILASVSTIQLLPCFIYLFDKSTKQKASLLEFCSFCGVMYRDIAQHVGTRWLGLEEVLYMASCSSVQL